MSHGLTIEQLQLWIKSGCNIAVKDSEHYCYEKPFGSEHVFTLKTMANQFLAIMQREAKLLEAIEIADNRLSQEPLTDVDIDVALSRLRLAVNHHSQNE